MNIEQSFLAGLIEEYLCECWFYMRAKMKVRRAITMAPNVAFDVIAELHNSPSQQIFAMTELALN